MARSCPTCASVIPEESPLGLCPRCCLISLGLAQSDENDLPGIEVGERIGGGSFGDVYEAIELDAGLRRVAIKFLHEDLARGEHLARFEDESRLLALLTHPHIARMLRAGRSASGRPYYVMELVEGQHLHVWARTADAKDRLTVLIQIADALKAAHQAGIIHRDLKPGNILVESTPEGPQARVIDFGIARALEGPATVGREATLHSQRLGTPLYMSPEQIAGDPLVDMRSDLFTFGLLIHEIERGQPALAGCMRVDASWEAQLAAIRNHVFPALDDQELGWIALKCCAIDPDERYQSAAELHADLVARRDGDPVSAGTHYWVYRSRKFLRRHRVAMTVTACLFLAIVSLGAAGWWTSVEEGKALAAVRAAEVEARLSASDSELIASFRAMDRGLYAEARKHLQSALELNPNNEEARYASRFIDNTVTFAQALTDSVLPQAVDSIRTEEDGAFHLTHPDGSSSRMMPDGTVDSARGDAKPVSEGGDSEIEVTVHPEGIATFTDPATGTPAMAPLVFGSGLEEAVYHPVSKRLLVMTNPQEATLWDLSAMGRSYQATRLPHRVGWLAFERETSDLWILDRTGRSREWPATRQRPGLPMMLGALTGPADWWSIGEGHTEGLPDVKTSLLAFTQVAAWHLKGGVRITCQGKARWSDANLIGGEAPNSRMQLGFQAPGEAIREVADHAGVPTLLALNGDGSLGVSVNRDGLVQLIDTSAPRVTETLKLELQATSLTMLDDGDGIVLAHEDGTLSVLEVPGLRYRHRQVPVLGAAGKTRGVQVRTVPGRRQILCRADGDFTLRRFETAKLEECAPPLRHEHGVAWFCADGNFLFSVDQNEQSNGMVRVWSLRTHRQIVPALPHPAPIDWVTILDQGSRIATAAGDHTVRRWTIADDSETSR